jgi:hypothetical protein
MDSSDEHDFKTRLENIESLAAHLLTFRFPSAEAQRVAD